MKKITLYIISLFSVLITNNLVAQSNWITPNNIVVSKQFELLDTGRVALYKDSSSLSFLLKNKASQDVGLFTFNGTTLTQSKLDSSLKYNHPDNFVRMDSISYFFTHQSGINYNFKQNQLLWRPSIFDPIISINKTGNASDILDSIFCLNGSSRNEGIHNAINYQGSLYFCSNAAGYNGVKGDSGYYYYDQQGFHSMGPVKGTKIKIFSGGKDLQNMLMAVFRDSLYVVHDKGYAVWYGKNWVRNQVLGGFDYRRLIITTDSLYICEYSSKKLINITAGNKIVVANFSEGLSIWNPMIPCAYKNGFVGIDYRDQQNCDLKYFNRSKQKWMLITNSGLPTNAQDVALTEWRGNLYAIGRFSFVDHYGDSVSFMARLEDSGFVELSGYVYIDKDGSCSYNADSGLVNRIVTIQPGDNFVSTDSSGLYSCLVRTNRNLTVYAPPVARNLFSKSCMPSSYSFKPVGVMPVDTLHFGFREKPNYNDLHIQLSAYTGWKARRGFKEAYELICVNTGNSDLSNVIVSLKKDSRVDSFAAIPSPTNLAGNDVTWNLGTMQKGEVRKILFNIRIDTAQLNLYDTISFFSSVMPELLDSFKDDNRDTLVQQIVGSFDPNFKAAYPTGEQDTNYVKADDDEIEYSVHFENLGTSVAENIVVTDTIAADFDIRYIQFTNYSHPFKLELISIRPDLGKGVLKLHFNNIKLPYKRTGVEDDLSSQGFVNFKIKMQSALNPQSLIKNKAAIYFDYNAPIITNSVVVKLKQNNTGIFTPYPGKESIISIYPNPGSEFLSIYNLSGSTTYYLLTDMLGKKVKEGITNQQITELSTNELPPGLYTINIYTDFSGYSGLKWLKQ